MELGSFAFEDGILELVVTFVVSAADVLRVAPKIEVPVLAALAKLNLKIEAVLN